MSAELDKLKATEEKEVIERRTKKEIEDLEWKRKMWKAIQSAREQCMEKNDNELCRRLSEAIGLKFIDNPASATSDKVGDIPVSSVQLSEGAFEGDGDVVEEKKQEHCKRIAILTPSFCFD